MAAVVDSLLTNIHNSESQRPDAQGSGSMDRFAWMQRETFLYFSTDRNEQGELVMDAKQSLRM